MVGGNSRESRARRAPTLRDIADRLGLDTSTVSKVMSGAEIRVREETRQAILAEAARQNYRPNATARSLRAGRTRALGILLPDFTNPVYASIVRGAVARSDALGYAIVVAGTAQGSNMSSYRRLVGERRIDGLIVATAEDLSGGWEDLQETDEENGAGEIGAPIPHVYVNRMVEGAGRSVVVDDERAAMMSAEHLIEAGHRRLGFVGADDSVDTARRRRKGFVAAAAKVGAEVVDVARPYSRAGGYEAGLEMMSSPIPPTAVFASNNLVGIGFLAALHAQKVQIPEQVSVITLEGDDAPYTYPPLTAVRLPIEEMGGRAVDELDHVLEGKGTRDVVIPTAPELIVRDSVGPPAPG